MVVGLLLVDDAIESSNDIESAVVAVVAAIVVVVVVVLDSDDTVVTVLAVVVTQIGVFAGQQIAGQVLKQFPSLPSSRIASHSNKPMGNAGKSPDKRLLLT